MRRYYVITALGLCVALVSGCVFYLSLDKRIGKIEPRIVQIEGEQESQGERLSVVERTRTVTTPGESESGARAGSRRPEPDRPAPRPSPAPDEPKAPPEVSPPPPHLPLLESTPRPCNEIRNDQKRRQCRQRRKARDAEEPVPF